MGIADVTRTFNYPCLRLIPEDATCGIFDKFFGKDGKPYMQGGRLMYGTDEDGDETEDTVKLSEQWYELFYNQVFLNEHPSGDHFKINGMRVGCNTIPDCYSFPPIHFANFDD